jgi:hypothetical protein
MIENEKGSFGTGVKRYSNAQVGNAIEFEAEKNAKGYWEVKGDVLTIELPHATVATGAAPKVVVDWDAKDRIIQLQSCRNSAIALVDVMIKNGFVKLPTKKDEQYDAVRELVAEITEQFTEENAKVRAGKTFRDTTPESEASSESDTTDNSTGFSEATWE